MTSITTHQRASSGLPLAMSLMMSFWIRIDPPLPRILSITPCQKSRPARVTTNDGSPIRVISVPWRTPISAHTTSAAAIAPHHGHPTFGFTSSARITAPRPATNPIDRSISPSSSAKISPIASRLKTADCTSRLTRFPAVRNLSFKTWNRIETRSSPATTGRIPISPPLMRAREVRRYSLPVFATSAGGMAAGVSSASSSSVLGAGGGFSSLAMPTRRLPATPSVSRRPWS
jgi:hypothetical protein